MEANTKPVGVLGRALARLRARLGPAPRVSLMVPSSGSFAWARGLD